MQSMVFTANVGGLEQVCFCRLLTAEKKILGTVWPLFMDSENNQECFKPVALAGTEVLRSC